jgi:diguanylate cyclase (GGDEF)-like protein/PAS domain S-box-containing protein
MPESRRLFSVSKILLVESDSAVAQAIEAILRPHVEVLLTVADGQQALEVWRTEGPDIVLTEIHVPGVDGLSLCEQVREIDNDAPVIVISSSLDSEHLRRAIEIGVNSYVYKPVDPVLLLDAVKRCMSEHQRSMDLRMARMVFEVANEGILITDERSRILAVNPAFSEITGYRPDEIVGQSTRMLSSGVHSRDFYRGMWNTLLAHGRWAGEIVNRRKDGSLFSEWLSIAVVEGDLATPRRYVGLVSDISERKKEEEMIRRLAHFDSLTGLPNRVLFNDRLMRALARAKRYRHSLAALYIDVDHFKSINDAWGHAIGDEVLQTVAGRLLSSLRQSDTVGRRGGDEFVAIVELDDHAEGLASVCQKLIAELSRPVLCGGLELKVGASIGAAVYPQDAKDPNDLLAAADAALYEAKAGGRGRFCCFQTDVQSGYSLRQDMEQQLRQGLQDWRYSLRYLPEISLASGKVERVEALLRFQHPEFGLIDAGRFLEIAEDIGLMPEIGQRAFEQALSDLAGLGGDLGLVVDISARELVSPNIVEQMLEAAARAGVRNDQVTFECTEAALAGNDTAMQTVYQLAASGCQFTLDDFGAGFCSFSLLSQLPMSSIKIDRSFVQEIESNPQIRELVAALIAFGAKLKLRTVAEGVETQRQLEILAQAGCHSVQGYLFGRPMSSAELKERFSTEGWSYPALATAYMGDFTENFDA